MEKELWFAGEYMTKFVDVVAYMIKVYVIAHFIVKYW